MIKRIVVAAGVLALGFLAGCKCQGVAQYRIGADAAAGVQGDVTQVGTLLEQFGKDHKLTSRKPLDAANFLEYYDLDHDGKISVAKSANDITIKLNYYNPGCTAGTASKFFTVRDDLTGRLKKDFGNRLEVLQSTKMIPLGSGGS